MVAECEVAAADLEGMLDRMKAFIEPFASVVMHK
jgi:hypothetical protein